MTRDHDDEDYRDYLADDDGRGHGGCFVVIVLLGIPIWAAIIFLLKWMVS